MSLDRDLLLVITGRVRLRLDESELPVLVRQAAIRTSVPVLVKRGGLQDTSLVRLPGVRATVTVGVFLESTRTSRSPR